MVNAFAIASRSFSGSLFFLSFLFSTFLFSGLTEAGEVYRYTDSSGVIVFTDTPTGRPSDLRVEGNDGGEGFFDSGRRGGDRSSEEYYRSIASRVARKYDLEPALVHAVIRAESNYDARALSSKGAIGLMQLMPMTARDMGVRNAYSPQQNIEGGVKYLWHMLERFGGDLHLALAAYNAGPEQVKRYGGIPPFRETQKYVKRVMNYYRGGESPAASSSPAVYRVRLDDGTIMYTNVPSSLGPSR